MKYWDLTWFCLTHKPVIFATTWHCDENKMKQSKHNLIISIFDVP